jgi:hypothetical protein
LAGHCLMSFCIFVSVKTGLGPCFMLSLTVGRNSIVFKNKILDFAMEE